MPQLVSERPIFLRETDGAYLPVTFLIAKTIERVYHYTFPLFLRRFFSVGLQGNFLIASGCSI